MERARRLKEPMTCGIAFEVSRPLMRRIVRRSVRTLAKGVVLVLTVSCPAALAQHQSAQDTNDIEEITVYGEKSLLELRSDFYDAQESFFSVFNSLNSDNDLDIECEFLIPVGQRRRYRVCAPRFSEKAQAAAAAPFLLSMHLARIQREAPDFNGASSSAFPHDPVARKKEKLMWEEMAKFLSENPELQEALSELVDAKDSYESARQGDR